MELLIGLIVLVSLDLAAWRRGAESRKGFWVRDA